FLNTPGGFAPLRELAWDGRTVTVNGGGPKGRTIVPLSRPAAFGAATFDEGGIVGPLGRGEVPKETRTEDELGFGEGALAYDLVVAPGAAQAVYLAFPLGRADGNAPLLASPLTQPAPSPRPGASEAAEAKRIFDAAFSRAVQSWIATVDTV